MIVSEYLNAILLGIVQGIAEFLPISSSGHLVIVNALLHDHAGSQAAQDENFQLTVALHLGTLGSILVVYRRELRRVLLRPRFCLAVMLATLPLVAIGLAFMLNDEFKQKFDSLFTDPLLAGCCLLVTAVLLVVGQRLERSRQVLDDIHPWQSAAIGLFQAGALLPGISRSGSTIAGGLISGLGREAATAFSFFIAIPAIAGAGLLALREASSNTAGGSPPGVLLVGAAVSFVVGLFALRWLIRIVSQQRLHWFAAYCAVAGAATVVWQLAARFTGSE